MLVSKGAINYVTGLIMAVVVMVLIIAIVLFASSGARGELSLQTCQSIMHSQCTSCVSGSVGGNCWTYSSGFLSCGCNVCDLKYASFDVDPTLINLLPSCVNKLKEIGIAFTDENNAEFNTVECNKIGVSYFAHCPSSCSQAPNNDDSLCPR